MRAMRIIARTTISRVTEIILAAVFAFVTFGGTASAATLEDIDGRLRDIAASYAADDPEREQLERTYAAAKEHLNATARYKETARQYELAIKSGPGLVRKLESRLVEVREKAKSAVLSAREMQLPLEALERLLDEAESERINLKNKVAQLESAERDLIDEPDDRRAQRQAALDRIAELETSNGTSNEKNSTASQRAADIAGDAEVAALRARLRQIEQAQLSFAIRLETVRAQVALTHAELVHDDSRIAALDEAILSAQRKVADSVIEETQAAQASATESHPLIQRIADENAELGQELSRLIEQQKSTRDEESKIEQQRLGLEKAFERTQDRLKYVGYGRGLGHLLIDQRRRIPDPRRLALRSEERHESIARIGLRSIEIDDWAQDINDPTRAIEAEIESFQQTHANFTELGAARAELVETFAVQRNLLDVLSRNYSNILQSLGDTEFEAQRLTRTVAEFGDFLETKITWTPNAPFVSQTTFTDAWRAAKWLFSREHWSSAAADMWHGMRRVGRKTTLMIFAFATLLWLRRPIKLRLIEYQRRLRHIRTDKFRYTLGALVASVLMALPPALVLAIVARLVGSGTTPSAFSDALAAALNTLAPIIFVFGWLRQFLREHGVAQEHFRWRDWLTTDVERATGRLVVVLLPAYFVAVMFENQGNAAFQYGLGRLAYVVAMLAVLNFAYRVAHPDGFVARHVVLRYPNSLVARLQLPIRITAIVLPLSFVLLATAGYYYTALNLGRYLMQTAALIIIAITLRSLAMRWLLLAESRLALKRAKERLEAERKAADENVEPQEISEDDLPIDIATINTQTRMILSNVIGWSFAVGLYFIWQGALPAFGVFESISLWEIEVAGANGTEFQQITLATVLIAAVIFTVTIVAAKNLPGVLEIGLLQRLPLQPGSRYAITTLAQYLITAVGVTIAISALGARWSQVQWLVAALSVGLGFGLQEIVANFISGIILLFERPIRVGDTVTIGELTGKVARIRIRATTIVDWDNKEIVVPNKNFITERFINWTLSDPVNRVRVNIGIAYGSDVRAALKIMTEVAQKEKMILDDPAPRALFLGFGDSSLDFEMQVYIRDMADRLPVVHELHIAINERFAEASIEIPFPQRDLHVRSVSEDIRHDVGDLLGSDPKPQA